MSAALIGSAAGFSVQHGEDPGQVTFQEGRRPAARLAHEVLPGREGERRGAAPRAVHHVVVVPRGKALEQCALALEQVSRVGLLSTVLLRLTHHLFEAGDLSLQCAHFVLQHRKPRFEQRDVLLAEAGPSGAPQRLQDAGDGCERIHHAPEGTTRPPLRWRPPGRLQMAAADVGLAMMLLVSALPACGILLAASLVRLVAQGVRR